MSLYLKYRPKTFDEIVGQPDAVKLMKAIVAQNPEDRPKVFLFGGASGCGKTTLATVFARAIGCDPNHSNFTVMDASKDRSIDRIRELCDMMGTRPIGKEAQARIFLLDECHQLLKPAQEALLKKCEDTPPQTIIIFATTEPDALGKALRSRCKIITINPMSNKSIYDNLNRVIRAEGIKIDDKDVIKIARASDGNTRVSLQILENYMLNGMNADNAISMCGGMGEELKVDTIEICRIIVGKRQNEWGKVAAFCAKYKGQGESARQAILGYLRSCILKSTTMKDRMRFATLIEVFSVPHYDCSDAALPMQIAFALEV